MESIDTLIEVAQNSVIGPNFVGKWDLISSENFDQYMVDVGIGFLNRALAGATVPVIVINVEDDEWEIRTVTAIRTLVLKFKLGIEFEDTTPDGRTMTSIVQEIGNNRLEQIQTPKVEDGIGSRIVRYIDDEDHFVVELTALKPGALTARRVHRRKNS